MFPADVSLQRPLSDSLLAWFGLPKLERSPEAKRRNSSQSIGNLAGIASEPLRCEKAFQRPKMPKQMLDI
jgi:hypothetical protein